MGQPLLLSYGANGQQWGRGRVGWGWARRKILTPISEHTEEQRHTEPGWVAPSCEAPPPGASWTDLRTRAQGSNGKTGGVHLKWARKAWNAG